MNRGVESPPDAAPGTSGGPRAALLLAAVGVVVATCLVPAFRAADGWLTADAVLPFGGAAALAVLGLAAGTPLRRTALWTAIALLGGAATCRLTLAGTPVRYQHLRPQDARDLVPLLSLCLLGGQTLLAAFNLYARRRAVLERVRAVLRPWQVALLLCVWAAIGAAPSVPLKTYAIEIVIAFVVALVHAITVGLAAAALDAPSRDRVRRAADRLLGPDEEPSDGPVAAPRLDAFAWRTAIVTTVVCAALAFFVYERFPHIQDEVKYLFHAKYFAAGRLGLPMPAVPDAFEMFLLEDGPHGWYSVMPPGWPAVLALGEALAAGWLVNPLLAGLDVLLVYLFLQELHDRRTARLGTLLYAISPCQVFLGMSFMTHHLSLACALVGALGVAWTRRTGNTRWAWIGGLALGWGLVTRQLDGAIVAVLCGLWALGLGGRRIQLSGVVGLVLGAVVVTVGLMAYNAAFTGDPRVFPVMSHCERLFGPGCNAYGFGPNRGMGWQLDPGGRDHGPVDGLVNAALNTSAMHVELFGWACGSLVLFSVLVLRGRWTRSERAQLAVVALVFVAYFFNYFGGGPDFGARYWHTMIVPLAALTACELRRLGRLTMPGEPATRLFGPERVLLFAGVSTLVTLTAFMPWRCLDKYHDYRGMRPGIEDLAPPDGFGNAVVLVAGNEVPDLAGAILSNPLDVNTEAPVFAWDRSAEVRRALVAAYPGRRFWLVDGPSRTGGDYALVDGPLDAAALLALPFDAR